MTAVNDLLKLAIAGHGGPRRWEQLSRFRVAASITGAIWALKGQADCWTAWCSRARPGTSG